jgi:hypothetical protein
VSELALGRRGAAARCDVEQSGDLGAERLPELVALADAGEQPGEPGERGCSAAALRWARSACARTRAASWLLTTATPSSTSTVMIFCGFWIVKVWVGGMKKKL